MSVHVFGIRHHGPGSARSLLAALPELKPDLVLVEGPVEGDDQIRWISDPAFQPPVALLVFQPDEPLSSAFYPFASFSPEWNALSFATENQIPVRFMDLPKTHWMALEKDVPEQEHRQEDPLNTLAHIAGEDDFERWWDRLVESKGNTDVFPAIYEAMSALREDASRPVSNTDLMREAAMRQQIRFAEKAGHSRIAVVCGAWHAPVLVNPKSAKEDAAMLKGLPKVKVQVSWVPWTHGRLMRDSGYGAGIESPGWYEHLWTTPAQTGVRWMSRVAQLLRSEDLDASPAQVVDAVRLAEALASFRGRAHPGLAELNDATEAALLFGNRTPLQLIHRKLVVGELLGEVPSDAIAAPIQRDLEALQKRLRLKPEAFPKPLDLDLRKPVDQERSHLLHRLRILDIPWGEAAATHGKLGTFHEIWQLKWDPAFVVELVAATRWGNTVETAATGYIRHVTSNAQSLPELTRLLGPVLKADLPEAAATLVKRVRDIGALAPDITDLMEAIPPLALVARYGDVRGTDQSVVHQAITELFARVCVGLSVACGSLNDEAARQMANRIVALHNPISVLEDSQLHPPWHAALRRVADLPGVHGLVSGRCSRILFDSGLLSDAELSAKASQSMSPGIAPAEGAAWIEGLLDQSGSVLLANQKLWTTVDDFIQSLPADTFQATLPLLRRTFSSFPNAERRQLGERVRAGGKDSAATLVAPRLIDHSRGAKGLPLLLKILGLENSDVS